MSRDSFRIFHPLDQLKVIAYSIKPIDFIMLDTFFLPDGSASFADSLIVIVIIR